MVLMDNVLAPVRPVLDVHVSGRRFELESGGQLHAVGELQFDVIRYRLEHEYKASCELVPVKCYKACWITSDDAEAIAEFARIKSTQVVLDKDGNEVFMAPSSYILDLERGNFPSITFHLNSEFKTAQVEA